MAKADSIQIVKGLALDMEEDKVKLQLELMKRQLVKMVEEKASFIDPSVIALSQEMDRLIVHLQKIKYDQLKKS